MYAVVSPAKKLDFTTDIPIEKHDEVLFKNKAFELIKVLRQCKPSEISRLMKLSDSLTKLNVDRYQKYEQKFTSQNSRQAIFAFSGDTYKGLEAQTLKKNDIDYAHKHLGILSGLYGLLRPLDRIQPYRLEMGTKLSCGQAKDLYQYWSAPVTDELNQRLEKEKYLINLSSNEYFSVLDLSRLKGVIIHPVFKEKKGGDYKVVGISAKKARGRMARFIIENRLSKPEELKNFDVDGYRYSKKLSNESQLVFTRG